MTRFFYVTAIGQIMTQLQYWLFSVDGHVDDAGEQLASRLFPLRWLQLPLRSLLPHLCFLPQALLFQLEPLLRPELQWSLLLVLRFQLLVPSAEYFPSFQPLLPML